MKSFFYLVVFALVSLCFCSCKDKNKTDDIIVDKVVPKPQNGPESMGTDECNGSVAWVNGDQYAYTITRQADDSLSVVENHGKKYHGNKVTLVVSRPDGTQFFRKTFTKSNFEPVLPEQFRKTGVLLGIKLDKAEGSNLKFVVSVGSPDENNDEFYLVGMVLDKFGSTSCEKYAAQADNAEE